MKKQIAVALFLIIIMIVSGCGLPGDPMLDDMYSRNIYPGTADTYSVGSEEYPYSEGWLGTLNLDDLLVTGDADIGGDLAVGGDITTGGDITPGGTLILSNDPPIILLGDGQVWLEYRPDLDYESVRAHGVPTWIQRGVFGAFSLPIAGVNEILTTEMCVPFRWYQPAWQRLGSVGDRPGGMAVYQGKLYIPCFGDDNVWVYDGTSLGISGNVGNGPGYSCVYSGNLYVTCRTDDTVWVFNGATWTKSGDVGGHPEGMAVLEGDLYVACEEDDEIWRLSGGVWAVDSALGLGGVAGAVGTEPLYLAGYGGDLYCGCGGADDDVWIRTGGAWAKDDDVDDEPQEFHTHNGSLYLNCSADDTIWARTGGVWAVVTNVETTIGTAPIGLEEYDGDLFSACKDEIWSDIENFWNINSDFDESEVPTDQPMFLKEYADSLYCSCEVGDAIWVYSGETAYIHIHCWITDAQLNATDAFRINLEFENVTTGGEVIPASSSDVTIEFLTGIAVAHQSYEVIFPLDMTGVDNDDNMGIVVDRIASSDEIVGEIAIHHIGLVFLCDKIGSPIAD